MEELDSPTASGPWLKNSAWAAREIRCGPAVRGFFLVLAYLVIGAPIIGLVGPLVDVRTTTPDRLNLALAVSAVLLVLGGLTFFWLRSNKYGDSICRLITLPGVIGGWFKADVECKLPPDPSEPVTVQLINQYEGGRVPTVMWEMEHTISSASIPIDSTGRAIVHVRLRIPRIPEQEPIPLKGIFFLNNVAWILKIKKKAPDISFAAAFSVPIYDIPDAPKSEQLPE